VSLFYKRKQYEATSEVEVGSLTICRPSSSPTTSRAKSSDTSPFGSPRKTIILKFSSTIRCTVSDMSTRPSNVGIYEIKMTSRPIMRGDVPIDLIMDDSVVKTSSIRFQFIVSQMEWRAKPTFFKVDIYRFVFGFVSWVGDKNKDYKRREGGRYEVINDLVFKFQGDFDIGSKLYWEPREEKRKKHTRYVVDDGDRSRA